MKPILEIQHISKSFKLYHKNSPYLSLRERLTGVFKKQEQVEEFWALNDISCTIAPGESLGIIGRNGAGKSTLLKILSRITPPTRGRIICRGRIASLLEVGTGFHQELTGRENVYMNGSILGMKKSEIDKHFDEIIAFSDTEKFLDTPLKHYSSGMQLRLAFAVAAHLEPEILIIDEVLAVGDLEFQRKCLGKMESVTKSGRTILFVSHNMGAVSKLCTKGLLLSGGTLGGLGPINEIIEMYNGDFNKSSMVSFEHPIIKSVEVIMKEARLFLKVKYDAKESKPIHIGFVLSDQFSNKICGSNPKLSEQSLPEKVAVSGTIIVSISSPKLNDGMYKLSLWAGNGYTDFFHAEDCVSFKVEGMINRKIKVDNSVVGAVIPEASWEYGI